MTHDEMIAKAYREWRELVEATPSLDKPMEIAFVAGFRAAERVIAPAVLEEAIKQCEWPKEAELTNDFARGMATACCLDRDAIRAMKTRYEQ